MDYEARRYPVVTFSLMGANVAMYLLSWILLFAGYHEYDPLIENLGLIPAEKTIWTWVTSMFVHGGFFHITGNLVYLFLFGACIEDLLGRGRYVAFYLGGGLLANLAQVVLTTGADAEIPIVGASGAISACIGAFLVVLPRTQINFRYFGWFFIKVFNGEFWIKAWIVIVIWFLLDFVSLVLDEGGGGVAFGAHVGGTIAGALAMLALRRSLRDEPENEPDPGPPKSSGPVRVVAPEPRQVAAVEPETIFVSIAGEQQGPYSASALRTMVDAGSITLDSHYWREGMAEWRPLAEFDEGSR